MTYIGIDVSKDSFVVAYSPDKNSKTKTFKNTTRGIHEFISTISKEEHHCVMEATGNYSALLAICSQRQVSRQAWRIRLK